MNVLKSAAYPYNTINGKDFFVENFGLRFHFNGKEMDNETYGSGNTYDYGFRIYNPRLGKFLSVDPLTKSYAFYTPYQFAGNKPIVAVDLDGREDIWYQFIEQNDGTLFLVSTNWDVNEQTRKNLEEETGTKINETGILYTVSYNDCETKVVYYTPPVQIISSRIIPSKSFTENVDAMMKEEKGGGFDGVEGQAIFHSALDKAATKFKDAGAITAGVNPALGEVVYKVGDVISTANGYMKAAGSLEDGNYLDASIEAGASTVGLFAGDKAAGLFKDQVRKIAASYLTDKIIDKGKEAIKENVTEDKKE